uniref:Post GPI attachment to protein factor 2 n=1 Tax=Echinococcus granulosus TaxID=6210 RepID=A0A068WFI6_ECHGR|nr:Post GPI attachment to protein factor 2 [Echinococcus granulosus]
MEGRLGSLNFRDIAVTTLYLPFCCMIGCLSYAMFFYFDEVTESKCGVHNFVPSISGAVCMRPLLHLWRFCIVAHAVPRVFVTHLYYRAHMALADKVTLWKSYTSLVSLVYLFDLTDILSLCGLTIVSTVDNFNVHEFFFIIFGLSSLLYMTLKFYLHFCLNCQRILPRTFKKSLEDKAIFLTLMLFCGVFAAKYYYEHHILCRPNAFSWFSIAEFGIAFANMGFHGTAAKDFYNLKIVASLT